MENSWKVIEKWLAENSATILVPLNVGINHLEIENLETKLKVKLPEEFICFYKVHNGQKSYSDYGLFSFQELLSSERIINEWATWYKLMTGKNFNNSANAELGIKNNWWNPLWIPITSSEGGDTVCIDLDPTNDGVFGQIIAVYHDEDLRHVLAGSFSEWITKYVKLFESGEMLFSEDFGILDKKTLSLMQDEINEEI